MISVHLPTTGLSTYSLLPRVVQSILNQDYTDFELILFDDSNDSATRAYLDRLRLEDSRIRVITNPVSRRNTAYSLARCLQASNSSCPYILWMWDDCLLLPHALRTLSSVLVSDTEFDFVVGSTVFRDADRLPHRAGAVSSAILQQEVLQSSLPRIVPTAGLLAKKDFFQKVGWFDACVLLSGVTDWEFFRRMSAVGKFAAAPADVVESFRARDSAGHAIDRVISDTVLARYLEFRDKVRFPLTVDAALYDPVDRVPEGNWSRAELQAISTLFLEYFLSIGDTFKADEWSERLAGKLDIDPPWSPVLCRSNTADSMQAIAQRSLRTGMTFGYAKAIEKAAYGERMLSEAKGWKEQSRTLRAELVARTKELEIARLGTSCAEERIIELEGVASSKRAQVRKLVAANTALTAQCEEQEAQLQELRIALSATRYRIIDSFNAAVKRRPFIHQSLKQLANRFR